MLFISLVLGLGYPAFASDGLLRLLGPALTVSVPSCPRAYRSPAVDAYGACLQEICERQEQIRPADVDLIAQIERTPDPRDAVTKRATAAAIDRGLGAARRLRELSSQTAQTLVQATLKQGPEAMNKLLRNITTSTFATFPLLRNQGGVGTVFPPELRADPKAIAAAQGLVKRLYPQLAQDFLARLATENFVPFGALAEMRQYYGNLARTSPDKQKKAQAQALVQQLNAVDGMELYGQMMQAVQKTDLGFPEVQLKCEGCEGELEALITYQLGIVTKEYTDAALATKRAENIKKLEQVCQVASWGLANMAPSEAEKKALQVTFEQVKAAYRQRVFSLFSGMSQQALNNMPMELDTSIEQEGKILPSPAEISKLLATVPKTNDALEVMSLVKGLDSFGKELMCEIDYAMPTDNFNPALGTVNISPWVAKRAEAGVVAHEFGHLMADHFARATISVHSLAKYKEVRACLTSVAGGPLPGGDFRGDGLRTEEDTADFFSQIAGFNMARSMCSMQADPAVLLFGRAKPETLVAPADDPHSSDLWRAIHSLVLSDIPVPEVCQQALEDAKVVAPADCRKALN